MVELTEAREGPGDPNPATTLTAQHHADLVSEAHAAELALAAEGVARLRDELHSVSVELGAVSAELEAVKADLTAARAEIDQLRLPAARYERIRDLVPRPVRRSVMGIYRAFAR
jgi:hypothetical protein